MSQHSADLRLQDVTCRYGEQLALDRVSLHVRAGDCYGFLGHNGAGKTTAMRVALGLLRPRSGTVLVDGFDVAVHPREARARLGGLIERPGFHDHLTGARNLEMLARLQGLAAGAARAESARVIGEVGLGHAGNKPAGAYSQGMRQRLGIAQALLGRPRVILLDEPTNGLDPEGIDDVRRLFRRLVDEEDVTLLISSHQLHEVAGICNRIGILREGRMLVEEETAALLSAERVRVVAGNRVAAARVLADRGLTFDAEDSEFLVDVSGDEADSLVQALVAGGAQPRAFSPHQTTLQDVYLRVARGESGDAQRAVAPVAVAPRERIAPAGPVRRVFGYEMRRLCASRAALLALAAPAVAGVAAVVFRYANARGFAAEVAAGDLASTTDVTAFEGVATALRAGLPVLAIVAVAFGSQQIAGERGRGTLRNVLLRPLSRHDAAAGKALALAVIAAISHLLLVAAAFAAAAVLFDFTDVTEELWNGEKFQLVKASELWPPLRLSLVASLPAVFACAAIGLAAGAVFRRSTSALVAALGALGLLDVGRAVLSGVDLEQLSPLQYVPTWLRDRSFVRHFMDLSQGVSNTSFDLATEQLTVPLVWCSAMFALSAVLLVRRSVL